MQINDGSTYHTNDVNEKPKFIAIEQEEDGAINISSRSPFGPSGALSSGAP